MPRSRYEYGNTAAALERRTPTLRKLKPEGKTENAVHVHHFGVILAIGMLAVMLTMLFQTMSLSVKVTTWRKEADRLSREYTELKKINDLHYEDILAAVDLDEVRDIAENQLGMKLAGEGQIIEYSGEIEDYVKQYENIPTE